MAPLHVATLTVQRELPYPLSLSLVISGEVNQMVCPAEQRVPMAVNKNKIFLSWANYRYWGFPDHKVVLLPWIMIG